MGFSNFLRGLTAQVNPFDRGKTYGSYNSKKKKQEQERFTTSPNLSVENAQPTQRITVAQQPKPKTPTNIFATLNKGLVFNKPQTTVPVVGNQNALSVEVPQPGTVVKPTIRVTTAPAQEIRVGNNIVTRNPHTRTNELPSVEPRTSIWDANKPLGFMRNGTIDFYRGVATVPSALARAGTGAIEGAAEIPSLATTAINAPIQLARKGTVRGSSDNVVNNMLGTIKNKVFNPLDRGIDKSAEVIGGKNNMDTYKNTQIGANIIGLLVGLGELSGVAGGTKAVQGAEQGSKLSKLRNVLNFAEKQLSASDDASSLISRFSKPIMNVASNVVNTPIKGTKSILSSFRKTAPEVKVPAALSELPDDGDVTARMWLDYIKGRPAVEGSALSGEGAMAPTSGLSAEAKAKLVADARAKVNVPIKKTVPVTDVTGDSLDVPVQVRTPKGPVIRELEGDAKIPTTRAETADRLAQIRRDEANAINTATVPDKRVEGLRPRTGEKPFTLDSKGAVTSQDKIIDDYANTLRNMGEGNGVAITADGRRVSDNVRTAETAGKKMTKAAWRAEAERQLQAGKADSSVQGAFNDAADPEIQALLNKGEQLPVAPGRPINVKQATGIHVRDETISQDLPKTPGKVRVTEAKTSKPVETPPAKATATPATAEAADKGLDSAYEKLIKSLKENQTAQKVEKKINSAEKSRRFAERQRLYDEMVADGMSRKEAEAKATAALKGKYTDNTVANFDVDSKQAEDFRKAIDEVSDDPFNTKRAFEHLIDPTKTDPLQPWERTRIRRFVQKSLGEDAAQSLEEAITTAEKTGDRSLMGNIGSFITSVTASGDISGVGRQGLSGLINHPKMSGRAFKEAIDALADPKKAEAFVSKLVSKSSTAFKQEQMGIHYLSLSDVADEARGHSDWAEKFAGTRWFVNPSERHYNTYIDSLRDQQSDAILARYGGQDGFLKAAQAANPENPEKWSKAWGKVLNAASGRGSVGKSGSPTIGDVQVLFSYRNLTSKLQRLTSPFDLKLLKTNPDAYLYQLKEVGTQAAVLGTALVGAKAAGLDVENGKIKIGKSRYDITAGQATLINSINNVRKAIFDPKEGGFSRTGGDVIKDFLQNQLSPMLGGIAKLSDVNWSEKKDKYGNPVDAAWLLKNAVLPAPISTSIESKLQDESWLQTAGNLFANALGVNVNTYQSAADKEAAGGGKSGKAGTGDSGGSATDYASFKAQAPKEGFTLQQLDDGSYAYSIDGETHQTSNLKKAREAIAMAGFSESGEDSKIIGDKHYYLNENGEPKSEYKFKYEHDKENARNTLEMDIAKDAEDYGAWNEAATKQLASLEKLRDNYNKEGQEDEVDKVQLKIENLKQAMRKYKGYGGAFTKGKGAGSRQLDTSFGTLKGSPFAPQVQQYATIDAQSSSIPRISVKRPNIVHAIRQG